VIIQHVAQLGVVDFGVWDALRDILLLLLVALLLGTIAERLQQSVIVGYLIAGTLVGPNVLGWISKQQEIYYIAELGVALLLFVIGLEFSPRRLLELGKTSLGTGILQIIVTGAATWAIAKACGIGSQEALVISMMIAMSSTACVLRLLTDRAELEGLHGRAALGILLVQDVAVVPMILRRRLLATSMSNSPTRSNSRVGRAENRRFFESPLVWRFLRTLTCLGHIDRVQIYALQSHRRAWLQWKIPTPWAFLR
jgi:predicted Kef-type K+ transport protein